MKKLALALLLVACFAVKARSQEQPPQLLLRAAHCLSVKSFFPSKTVQELTFGYLVDEKSYPGKRVMYVVSYAAFARSNGSAFAIVLTQQDDHQSFDIQNNAAFVLSKRGIHGVSFATPPLGGDWTQERLASAIERIEKQPRFTITAKDMLTIDPSVSCEAYTDPQPKPNVK
ncbi:MAG: hypothetical protein P4L87_11295 [Formivibrio sp.]|nr:hypothetical protein [Formivibrio sp.]